MTAEDWGRSWKAWLRGTVIGFDRRDAGGRRRDRHVPVLRHREEAGEEPGEFGHGAIEGVARPEAANNASAAGTLVPLLTLGLPTSATAAIMLAGFQQYGLQPGPLLFANNPQLVWGLIASLLIANAMLLVLNLPMIGLWVRLLTIPKTRGALCNILLFATLGTIGANPSVFELGTCFRIRRARLHPCGCSAIDRAPAVVGLILGPSRQTAVAPGARHQPGRCDDAGHVADRGGRPAARRRRPAFIIPLILRLRGRGQVLSQLAANED